MTLLSEPLALHAVECGLGRCSCGPVRDVEALVRRAVRVHHRGGLGPEGGREVEDLLAAMIAVAWEASARPRSPGWARRPFVDFVVALVHDRITDWYRRRYPGSRYGRALEIGAADPAGSEVARTPALPPPEHVEQERFRARRRAEGFHEPLRVRRDRHEEGEAAVVDVEALSVSARWTYWTIAVPMARQELGAREVAALRRPSAEEHPRLRFARGNRAWIVECLLRELRVELRAQGVGPTVRADPGPVAVEEAMTA